MYDCHTIRKFQHCHMVMGLKTSPDVAQSIMEQVLCDLDVEVYIDDIRIFSNSWEDHCKALDAVLECLQENGFKVNPLKCEWGVDKTDFLGHWLTPKGVKPWKKKINAI
jgi:thiol-disulfide isomerase/thioredoxin